MLFKTPSAVHSSSARDRNRGRGGEKDDWRCEFWWFEQAEPTGVICPSILYMYLSLYMAVYGITGLKGGAIGRDRMSG